ncbi:hypothetical protein CHS0354_029412 [Potamilus streckersoni]|uniref:Uncharacterized protein n=1 Tax=Potamilus streckersoni TaxID=2493646 RepID=A0AAE0W1C4_9BIVA|nr:hypothetical protein CHS0354_029412 [Potamilus streckersoni]
MRMLRFLVVWMIWFGVFAAPHQLEGIRCRGESSPRKGFLGLEEVMVVVGS